MKERPKIMVVAIYSHPEYYPPTLNALDNLAALYSEVYVVHRNIKGFDWVYPENVKLVSKGIAKEVGVAEQAGVILKIIWFLRFTWLFFLTTLRIRPRTILIYDFLPILSYRLFYWLIQKPGQLWYHNHDVGDARHLKKFSLSWLAWKSEKWIFGRLDSFSLPAVERKSYFPMDQFKGRFYFIPNYPSLSIYTRFREDGKQRGDEVKLLYQGSIGPDHGLEEIITILGKAIPGKKLRLVLKGFIQDGYRDQLERMSEVNGVADRVTYMDPTGYREVILNAQTCHIGIAIHKKQDIMNATLGTASNKIYEYAACGLPVILYDNPHFKKVLGGRKWVFFTDGSAESILTQVDKIMTNLSLYQGLALKDFTEELNFEYKFSEVVGSIQTKMSSETPG